MKIDKAWHVVDIVPGKASGNRCMKSTANNEQIARRELEQTLASLKKAMPGFIDAVEKALHETLDPYLSALGECLSKAEEVKG